MLPFRQRNGAHAEGTLFSMQLSPVSDRRVTAKGGLRPYIAHEKVEEEGGGESTLGKLPKRLLKQILFTLPC